MKWFFLSKIVDWVKNESSNHQLICFKLGKSFQVNVKYKSIHHSFDFLCEIYALNSSQYARTQLHGFVRFLMS